MMFEPVTIKIVADKAYFTRAVGTFLSEFGVALCAALDRPGWGSAIRIRSAVLQGSTPVRHDVEWQKLPQAQS